MINIDVLKQTRNYIDDVCPFNAEYNVDTDDVDDVCCIYVCCFYVCKTKNRTLILIE